MLPLQALSLASILFAPQATHPPVPEPTPHPVGRPVSDPTSSTAARHWVDVDRDGLLDLFVADPRGDRLFVNLGRGGFEDRTAGSGLAGEVGSVLVRWGDWDGDGWLDVYRARPGQPGELLRNSAGVFSDVTDLSGLGHDGADLDARWVDFDLDGDLDLELTTTRGARLHRNERGVRFELVFERADLAPPARPAAVGHERLDGSRPHAPRARSTGALRSTPGAGTVGSTTVSNPATNGRLIPDQAAAGPPTSCFDELADQGAPGSCLQASSVPTLGRLFPLTPDLFVSALGDVGIGTLSPAERLDVAGTLQAQGLKLPSGAAAGRVLTSDGSGAGSWQPPVIGIGGSGTAGYLPLFTGGAALGDSVAYQNVSGFVGVGTTSPTAFLHIRDTLGTGIRNLRLEGAGADGTLGRLQFGTTSSSPYLEESGSNLLYLIAAAGTSFGSGNVGIHTDPTGHALTVLSTSEDALRLIGPEAFGAGSQLNFGDGDYAFLEEDTDDHLLIRTRLGTKVDTTSSAAPALEVATAFGNGLTSPALVAENTATGQGVALWAKTFGTDATAVFTQSGSGSLLRGFSGGLVFEVRNDGRVVAPVIEITGGADLVEPFDTGDEVCTPGTVVVIDPERPGGLRASSEAYDSKVAGIVSGAGGVEPGLRMGQAGVLDGDTLVAMTGRVYVRCTTENGAVTPGDLLTTADTAGHAMRATDRERSHGTVIGKAMTPLDAGPGLVLVLVNLQ